MSYGLLIDISKKNAINKLMKLENFILEENGSFKNFYRSYMRKNNDVLSLIFGVVKVYVM